MSHVVLWSGGMDSTLMLFQLATENKKDMINAVTIEGIGASGKQVKAEKKARKAIMKEFKSRKINNIQNFSIDVNSDITTEGFQMRMWFCYIMPNLKDGDHLHMAYLSSDGINFWSIKEKLTKAFEEVCKLREIKCDLSFDLQGWTKGHVIRDLKKAKLTKYTSYCGQPKKDLSPCGKCMKCMSVKRWKKYPESGIAT